MTEKHLFNGTADCETLPMTTNPVPRPAVATYCFVRGALPCCSAAFLASLKSRSVQAVLKYWSVLTLLMVGTLLLMYFMPIIGRFNPSFGFTAAAVGMSARVESTLFKVSTVCLLPQD